ncbi:hypothetical protein SDC9_192648 [bioreactor metagenome]|uniref:Uncharacterized protein n=1 Tax=bioreactor metagenome TaxID=1076179 RepID=A0A645I1B5_9ZZZZ
MVQIVKRQRHEKENDGAVAKQADGPFLSSSESPRAEKSQEQEEAFRDYAELSSQWVLGNGFRTHRLFASR